MKTLRDQILFFRIILLSLFFVTQNLFAVDWKVTEVIGSVEVVGASSKKKLKLGDQVSPGNLIRSSQGDKARFQFGGSSLWIGGKSQIQIPKNPGGSKPSVLNLLYGKIRVRVKGSGKERSFKYKTRSAVAGVRGTEFFIASSEEGDFFCTLENEVEVETDGQKILVPEGKGLRIRPGASPVVQDNSSFLVAQWVSETESDEQELVPYLDSYTEIPVHRKQLSKNIHTGLLGWTIGYLAKNKHSDVSSDDGTRSGLRTHLSPFLQIGKRHQLFLRPFLTGIWSNRESVIDASPQAQSLQHAQLELSEAFFSTGNEQINMKVGLQELQWAEGILLARQRWILEPKSHLGALAEIKTSFGNFEALLTQGRKAEHPLDGSADLDLKGLLYKAPMELGHIYFLQQTFSEPGAQSSGFPTANQVQNFGLFSQRRGTFWEYQVSGIYQNQPELRNQAPQNPSELNGSSLDFSFGVFPTNQMPLRFQARWLKASENFVSAHEDFYNLGQSALIRTRSNIEQIRLQVDYQVSENHLVFLEWIRSQELSTKGQFRQTQSTKENQFFAEEWNLGYNWKARPNLKLFLGGWAFLPRESLGEKDPALGLLSRLSFYWR